ncbi:MAG: hypothetical protein LAN63_16490 [Acidobacteriia bacterium]|nr:hypothetical protein [Terriglobia bacterium]
MSSRHKVGGGKDVKKLRCPWTLLANVSRALGLLVLVSALSAQVAEHQQRRTGIPQDWTHHHVFFNRGVFSEQPELAGREPRAWLQFAREMRAAAAVAFSAPKGSVGGSTNDPQRDWSVPLGTGHIAFGMSPAKFGFDDTVADCMNDYAVYGLSVAGVSGGQANLVAFNNLYSGTGGKCGSGDPTVLFSYDITTVTGGRILTAPVLSLDGSKIAFVESAGTSSRFHVLTWASGPGNGTSPTISAVPGMGNSAVLVTIPYSTVTDTRSSPWVDYISDVAYVAADDGKLYKFTGVFKGSPALAGAPWPVTLNANRRLTAPVLDQFTGNLFVGDSDGFLFSVKAQTGTVNKRIAVGRSLVRNPAIIDAPIVDASDGTVFAVSSNDGTSAVLVQADTATLTERARARIGQGSAGGTNVNLFDGAFDNNYFTNPASGSISVCGTGAADNTPWQYTFGFTGKTLNPGSVKSAQILNSTSSRCSPISEFFNPNIGTGGTDFFFWGMTADCSGAGTSGCVISRTASTTLMMNRAGGTSAIIEDGINPDPQASSIYFTDLGANNAVKLTQATLQ